MPGKLNIAFLWHMHQPYYRDPSTGKYALPWVRMHGLKGYTDMLESLRRSDGVEVTFNLVPCLMEQLDDLASARETDLYYDLSAKPASDLDDSEKRIILRRFFSANLGNMIMPYHRYRELLYRRGRRISEDALEYAIRNYSVQDFLDLQVWFNLTWFGWATEERYPLIRELKRKNKNFTEKEKKQLLSLQVEVLKNVLPSYRAAWEEGRIEVSTTPYYHPILPLLIDHHSARISQPKDPMPTLDFMRPDDAREQLQRGRSYAAEKLGKAPVGLWPSEGSVSPAVCDLAKEADFEWLATDEGVLMATLQGQSRQKILYRSYLAQEKGPTLIFRDRFLSDAIGFRYANNKPQKAVDDFVGHLENIASSQPQPEKSLVAIILDGENAWEYFPDGGRNFLTELYQRLSKHVRLKACTISDYIHRNPAEKVLPPIFPASWIGGSFRIWIGDPLKNQAWDRMAETAAILEEQAQNGANPQAVEKAKQWLYAAEGSDWFWWYGQPNFSEFEPEFDYLFRANLMQVYRELDLEIPEQLLKPISEEKRFEENIPLFPMQPEIDGRETNFYEWVGARSISAGDFSGSMNFSSSLIEKLFYGISETHLFIRLDLAQQFMKSENLEVHFKFAGTVEKSLAIKIPKEDDKLEINWQGEHSTEKLPEAAFDRILELKIPFEDLAQPGHEVLMAVVILQDNLEVERWPREAYYACPWPTADYLASQWFI